MSKTRKDKAYNRKKDAFTDKRGFVNYDKEKSNNIVWWSKNKNQYDEVTKVPVFAQIAGRPYNAGKTLPSLGLVPTELNIESLPSPLLTETMPGIMVLHYIPSIGKSVDGNSPINKAASSLMSELYARTSGSSLQFQQADLIMELISLSSISSLFAAAKRGLGVKDFWITKNLYYPKTLFKAMGFEDYDDMVKNFNSYCTRLNDLIAQFNQIKIPAWFDIFARHYALSKNVYEDEESEMAQIFLYKPDGVWRYSDVDQKCYLQHCYHFGTMGNLLDLIQDCLNDWLNSSDLYLINGALLRAFGDAQFIFIEPFASTERIQTVTDKYLSLQCMNATICGFALEADWEITQDPVKNMVVFDPSIVVTDFSGNYAVNGQTTHAFIRVFDDNPTPEDKMEMTRLTVGYTTTYYPEGVDGDSNSELLYKIDSCGTEVITRVEVIGNIGNPDEPNDLAQYSTSAIIDSNFLLWTPDNPTSMNKILSTIAAISPFRYIPRICFNYTTQLAPGYDQVNRLGELGDQYNYSLLDFQDLNNMHTAALYSIWKPSMPGRSNK